ARAVSGRAAQPGATTSRDSSQVNEKEPRALAGRAAHAARALRAMRVVGLGRVLGGFLHVAHALLNLALGLLGQALGLLFLAADGLSSGFLRLAGDVLRGAFELVLVHC